MFFQWWNGENSKFVHQSAYFEFLTTKFETYRRVHCFRLVSVNWILKLLVIFDNQALPSRSLLPFLPFTPFMKQNFLEFSIKVKFWKKDITDCRQEGKSEKLNFASFLVLSRPINSVFHMRANICNRPQGWTSKNKISVLVCTWASQIVLVLLLKDGDMTKHFKLFLSC